MINKNLSQMDIQTYLSPILPEIGRVKIWLTHHGLARLDFQITNSAIQNHASTECAEAVQIFKQMREYLDGMRKEFDIPLDWSGIHGFNQDVLRLTSQIPYGQTCTYGSISIQLGKTGSARAVGVALAHNPIPIIIPCHRVVGTDGKLHGYSGPGGIQTKAWLLQLEGARMLM